MMSADKPSQRGPAGWLPLARGAGVVLVAALLFCGCKPPAAGPGAGSPFDRPVQVIVAEAKRQDVAETLPLVGSLMADEMVEVKCETDGTIADIQFAEGEAVEKGQLLLRLDETKLAAGLAEAEANFALSQANYDRAKELYREKLISQQEFDQVSAAFRANEASIVLRKRQLADTQIHAPFAGLVGARQVSPGQVISKNTTLTWLADIDPVKVEINVPERFLGQIHTGQTIELTVAAFPGRPFRGQVYFVASFVEPATRTALVKAKIDNPKRELLPGMFANLDLTLKIRDGSIVIPEQALTKLLDDGAATLYVVDNNQTAQLRRVKVGVRMAGAVEILEGLTAGETVVIEGTQKIGPGSKVVFAPGTEKAAAPPADKPATIPVEKADPRTPAPESGGGPR